MKKHYALVGRGGGNKRVITASLNDLPQDSYFHVMWTGEPTDGEEVVYDWLIDNEKSFTIYGNAVPKMLARHAAEVSTEPMYAAARHEGCQTALVLWEEGSDDIVISASSIFPKMLELTNGLTPIEVDDDEAPVTPPVEDVVESQDTSEFFSRSELENMPAAAVKRQAKEKGLDITGKVKSQIIDMLLGEDYDEPVEVADEPVRILTDSDEDLSFLRGVIKDIRELDAEIARLQAERRDLLETVSQALDYEPLAL